MSRFLTVAAGAGRGALVAPCAPTPLQPEAADRRSACDARWRRWQPSRAVNARTWSNASGVETGSQQARLISLVQACDHGTTAPRALHLHVN